MLPKVYALNVSKERIFTLFHNYKFYESYCKRPSSKLFQRVKLSAN